MTVQMGLNHCFLIHQELCVYANSELNIFVTVVAALILPVRYLLNDFI